MPGDVLHPMHMPGIMSPLDPINRPHATRSVISEQSPLKKRRVAGSFSCEYEHQYSSRSGGLALLRVLTAPASPTGDLKLSPSSVVKHSRRSKSKEQSQSPPRNSRLRSPPRSSPPQQKPTPYTNPAHKATAHSRSISTPNMPPKDAPPASPEPAALKRARDLAGRDCVVSERYLPPTSFDAVAAFLDPESSDNRIGERSLGSQLKALASGQSMVVVYPTQTGTATFNDRVLGPVLDPVLRRAVNTHGLRPETAAEIRKMDAIDGMLDSNDLTRAIEGIVAATNEKRAAGTSLKLTSSVITTARMSPEYWKHHWVTQERRRIREIIQAGLLHGGASVEMAGISVPRSPVRVAEDMLDEFKSQKIQDWENGDRAPAAVEVGFFVITKEACA